MEEKVCFVTRRSSRGFNGQCVERLVQVAVADIAECVHIPVVDFATLVDHYHSACHRLDLLQDVR